eukprot:315407-Pleurochrysis_carterae.AAC.1
MPQPKCHSHYMHGIASWPRKRPPLDCVVRVEPAAQELSLGGQHAGVEGAGVHRAQRSIRLRSRHVALPPCASRGPPTAPPSHRARLAFQLVTRAIELKAEVAKTLLAACLEPFADEYHADKRRIVSGGRQLDHAPEDAVAVGVDATRPPLAHVPEREHRAVELFQPLPKDRLARKAQSRRRKCDLRHSAREKKRVALTCAYTGTPTLDKVPQTPQFVFP